MFSKSIEELKSKNLELEAILKTNPDLIFILDQDSNFLEVYTNTPKMLLIPKEEFIGKNLNQILPPSVFNTIDEKIKKAKKSSKLQVAKYDLEIENKKSYFEARIITFDQDKLLCIVRDVTEEENLKEIEKKYLFAIDSIGDGLWDWNMLTNEVFYSKRWKEMLGFEENELENNFEVFSNLLHEEDKELVNKNVEDYLNNRIDKYEVEFRIKNKKNEFIWVLARGKVFKNENNTPVRFVGSHTDINEKKLQILKNEELEKRWQFALEGSGDGVWDWDMVNNKVFLSKQWKSMLGYEINDLDDNLSNWVQSLHPDEKDEVFERLNLYLEGKTDLFISQHRALCKDGSYKWILDRGKVVSKDNNGKPLRMIGTHTDINELIITQEKLIKSENKLKNIIDTAGEYIWEADSKSRYTFVSEIFFELLGYTKEEVIGKSPYSFMLDEDKRKLQKKFFEVRRNNSKFKDIIFKIKKKSGELVWHSINGKPVFDESNNIIGYIGVGSDITDRFEKEDEIKYRESIFNSFVKLAPLGIALTDFNTGKFIEINDKIIEPSGYTKEEFLNLSYWDLTPTKYENQEKEQLRSLNEYGYYGPYQKEYIKKDGTTYQVLLNGIKIKDSKNQELIWSIVEDISEKVEKEKEILEKTSYMELAEKTAKLGNWIVDLVNGTVTWSDETKRIHEVPMDFVPDLEKGINFYDPEVREQVSKVVEEAIKTGKGWEFELPLITAKNNRVWVNAIADVIQENGVTTKIFGTFQDISERKRLQDERDKIFNMSLDLISVCDTNAYFKQLNYAWTETLEYSIEELKSKQLWEFLHPDDITKTKEAFMNVLSEPVFNFENRYLSKSGKVVWLSWNAQSNPDDLLIYSITRNITHTKEKEKELKMAKVAAEEANKTKSIFLANMSHEIRTPMNSILGFGEILLNRLENKENVEYVNSMISAGKTLLTLINDILDLSKIEAGRLNLELKDTNVNSMIKELSNMFSVLASKKHLTFNYQLDNTLPKILEVDEIRIRQVLLNLIGNSIKFTEKGGIEVKISHTLNSNKTLDLSISVLDTGIGIKSNNLELIFDEFRQQDDQSTRKYGGTGLGLSISKKLAKMMNGEIKVKSKLGVGSEFTLFLFNINYKNEENLSIKSEKNIVFDNPKLLIVDDNELNLLLLTTILKQVGITNIDKAYNGKEALVCIEKNNYDLVLMDIQMPEMDGIQATSIIKNEMNVKTPIIALTALAMSHNIEENEKYFDDYLTKPIELNVAINILKKYLKYKSISELEINKQKNIFTITNNDIVLINNSLNQNINNIIDTMQINEIIEIAEEILQIGENNNNQNIIEYANLLNEYADNFDIDMITKHLKDLL